jgi:DNA-binding response OmpR family regulator
MPKRILIVDDERAITSALSSLFTQAGYEALTAYTGPDALNALDASPDLMVLDVMLPGLDGHEVCRQVRQREAYIPIVMLTARDDSSDKILGLELGADVYITKPFEPRELLAQVRALFRTLERTHTGEDEKPVSVGPLKLWEEQHRVELSGRPLELTATEFALLLAFMRRPGRVLGRETLLREVWGHDYLGDSRMVDVHINRLRAKVEPNPSDPQLIATVRGFGYRLTDPAE